jgi:hypothetical protein
MGIDPTKELYDGPRPVPITMAATSDSRTIRLNRKLAEKTDVPQRREKIKRTRLAKLIFRSFLWILRVFAGLLLLKLGDRLFQSLTSAVDLTPLQKVRTAVGIVRRIAT